MVGFSGVFFPQLFAVHALHKVEGVDGEKLPLSSAQPLRNRCGSNGTCLRHRW